MLKSRKIDIGSKGLARDTIHNKGGYLAVDFNESKKNCLNHVVQCIYKMSSRVRIKASSREMMSRKVIHERKYEIINDE